MKRYVLSLHITPVVSTKYAIVLCSQQRRVTLAKPEGEEALMGARTLRYTRAPNGFAP